MKKCLLFLALAVAALWTLSACNATPDDSKTSSTTVNNTTQTISAPSEQLTEYDALGVVGGNDSYPCNHNEYYHTLSEAALTYVDSAEPGWSDKFIEMFGRTEDCNQRFFMDYFGLDESEYWTVNREEYVKSLEENEMADYAKTFNPEMWFAKDYSTNEFFLTNDKPAPDSGSVFIRPEGDSIHTDRYFTIHPSLIDLVGQEEFNEFKDRFGGTTDFNVINFVEYFNISKEAFTSSMEGLQSLYIYNPDYVYGTAEMQKQYFEKHILDVSAAQ